MSTQYEVEFKCENCGHTRFYSINRGLPIVQDVRKSAPDDCACHQPWNEKAMHTKEKCTSRNILCPCACHENKLKKLYLHDSVCCPNMNGTLHEHSKPSEECGAPIQRTFQGLVTCAERKPCWIHDRPRA